MAEVKAQAPKPESKTGDKHNAVSTNPVVSSKDVSKFSLTKPHQSSASPNKTPKSTNTRPPLEPRPPSAGQPATPRPPLNRVDSRPLIQQQQPRLGPPITPPQPQPQQHPQQQRPQFLPGGPVTAPPQLGPRPGTPGPVRAPIPGSLPQQPLAPRPQTPITRPSAPQSFAPQQASRPLGPPPPGQYLQRAPPPNNLQFGPRQPPQLGVPSTPEGPKPQPFQPPNGLNRSAVPPPGLPNRPPPASSSPSAQLSRQSSQASLQGSDISGPNQVKQGTLENLGSSLDKQNVLHPENGVDMPGATKTRSYSIAAPPGAPSPLKMEADRRTSVSAIGGRIEEIGSRGPTLGLIQEAKSDVSLKTGSSALKGSRESVRSDVSNESVRESVDHRPDSRLSGSKMSESFIGNFNSTPKKKADDDDDVVLQNQKGPIKQFNLTSEIKADTFDRSPSLSRSDSSPEPKQVAKPKVEPVLGGPKSLIGAIGANTPETPTTLPLKASETKVTPIKEVKTPPAKISSVAPSHSDIKSPIHTDKKPPPFSSPIPPNDARKSARNARSTPKSRPKDGDNDSGVDESTQGNDNGSPGSPNKKSPSKIPAVKQSNGLQKPSLSRSSSKSATAKTPENPPTPEKKKVPMNKVQVGNAPSPNIKAVKSKIGSLENTTYKPGGGKVKIENRKLDFNKATPKIAAKNETYTPGGGAKKITQTKLQWNAKSKIGSLDNTSYKPGGGDKKIETVKLEFKDKAKPKVASTVNITHKPGGGAIKIENQKLEFKAQSKVGSLDNVKYKPGGGEVKIFDDKEYIKQMSGQTTTGSVCQSGQEFDVDTQHTSTAKWSGMHQTKQAYGHMSLHEYNDEEFERPMSRCKSARYYTPRSPSPHKLRRNNTRENEDDFVTRNNEKNKQNVRSSQNGRVLSARDQSASRRRSSVRSGYTTSRRIIDERPPFSVY